MRMVEIIRRDLIEQNRKVAFELAKQQRLRDEFEAAKAAMLELGEND